MTDETVQLVAELVDLRYLFEMQQERMATATELWRAESPAEREHILPDLGRLLDWLMAQIRAGERRGWRQAVEALRDQKRYERWQLDVMNWKIASVGGTRGLHASYLEDCTPREEP